MGCKEFEATRPQWHQMPGAVQVSAANNISFTRDRFVNLGQTALGIGNDANAHATGVGLGASSISVTGSVFTASSAGAIVAGGVQADAHHPRDRRMINKDITISNNLVHGIGLDYRGIVSFLPTYVTNATISHNEIHDMPYTGIAFGYGWGANDAGGSPDYQTRGLYNYQPVYQTPTTAANNKIVNNYIHDTMQQMSDGSCIYSLSANPGGLIDGNYCANSNGHFGLYFDEGSRHITTSDNVFEATGRWAHGNYQGGNNTGALRATNNWTTNADTNVYNGDHGNTVGGNTTVTTGSWPSGAASTIAAAGIEPAYQDIKAGAVASPYRTYSSTPATFGQAGGQFTISARGRRPWRTGRQRDDAVRHHLRRAGRRQRHVGDHPGGRAEQHRSAGQGGRGSAQQPDRHGQVTGVRDHGAHTGQARQLPVGRERGRVPGFAGHRRRPGDQRRLGPADPLRQ